MPYTPPSQRSPASSGPSSPATSRRGSFLPGQPVPSSPVSQRPELPRSASYLTRHRRTPSVKSASFVTNDGTDSALPMTDRERNSLQHNVNLRKSPPPVTDESKLPSGVILSPPESAQNSSDDEELTRPRGRQIEKLSELQAAIRNIAQHRAGSPSDDDTETKLAGKPSSLIVSTQTGRKEDTNGNPGQKLTSSAIKISHSRSNTDTTLYLNEMRQQQADTPISESDDDETDDSEGSRSRKPMVRKKSGELVRPALRPSSRRRPSSMPGTPTFSKAVHFDSHLEHIRHFLQVDRPLAVSAGSSPVEAYASDSEFPFSDEEGQGRSLPFEWELTLANFPAETYDRLQLPVRVERFYLSSDNKMLIGQVAVANLAFNKSVVARFTLDYWKTTSEVLAEYTNDVRRKLQNDGYDRFNFTIKLADLANLEAKTMFFCVKYCVNGVEYWDNNNNTNFQVDFRKKMKPMNGKKVAQGSSSRHSNGLPRSGNRPSPSRRTPTAFEDDFADGFDEPSTKFRFPYSTQSGNFGVGNGRLKGVRSELALSTDSLLKKAPSPSGQAFSNRYDFGVSISAAIQAASSKSGGNPESRQRRSQQRQPLKSLVSPATKSTPELASSRPVGAPLGHHTGSSSLRPNGAEQPPLASQSYNELLDKYCFFGSTKNSPPLKDGTLNSRPAQYDGSNDSNTGYMVESDTSSPDNSSPLMMQMVKRPALASKSGSGTIQRSVSPAPMTGFVTAIRG